MVFSGRRERERERVFSNIYTKQVPQCVGHNRVEYVAPTCFRLNGHPQGDCFLILN